MRGTLKYVVVAGAVAVAAMQPRLAAAQLKSETYQFTCPEKTTVTFNWTNKLKLGPTAEATPKGYDNNPVSVPFKSSSVVVAESVVKCFYSSPPQVPGAVYSYETKRKIISCTGMPAAVFQCAVKP